jgi:hypothetical protein
MDDVNKNISEMDIVKRNQTPSTIQPLTRLVLEIAKRKKEEKSNAAGFLDANKKCVKLSKKQIKEGFVPAKGTACDTESKYGAPTVETLEEYLKNHPEAATQNENLKKEVDKAGGWEKFMAGFSTLSKTEKGTETLNTVGGLLGGLFGVQTTPESNVTKDLYSDNKGDGLNPVWWVVIGVGTIALLGGIAFAIYKFGVKKQVKTV